MMKSQAIQGGQSDYASWAALLLANFLWAVVYVLAKALFVRFEPMAVAFLRFSIACLFWGVILVIWYRGKLSMALWRASLLPGLVSIALYNLFYFPGLNLTFAVHAVVLVPGLGPAVTALLNQRFNRQTIHPSQKIGITISFIGVMTLMAESFTFGSDWRKPLLGDFILLGCTVCWSSYTLLIRARVEKGFAPIPLTAAGTILGSLILCSFIAITTPSSATILFHLNQEDFFNGLILGVAGTVMPYFLWNFALARIGTIRSAIFLNFLPICGALLSVMWLGEQPSLLLPLAMILVIIGVILTQNNQVLKPFFARWLT